MDFLLILLAWKTSKDTPAIAQVKYYLDFLPNYYKSNQVCLFVFSENSVTNNQHLIMYQVLCCGSV